MASDRPNELYESWSEADFRFVKAGFFWKFILRTLGFAGIVTPWRRIYLLPRYYNNTMLRVHEATHVMQLRRDGELKFWFLIVWYLIRYGYQNSPYEVEAREKAGDGTIRRAGTVKIVG